MSDVGINTFATVGQQRNRQGENGMSLIELSIVLAKNKWFIFGVCVAASLVAVVISFALPKVYLARAKLLPPQQSQMGAGALLAQLGGGAVAGLAGLKAPSELYVGMLKSRTIADRIIGKFNLKEVYGTDTFESARIALAGNTTINSGKDGLITIEVESKDQKLVAALTNAYVNELIQVTKYLAVTEASQRRLFFERELESSKDNLANAEGLLKNAIDVHGVTSVDIESRAFVETLAAVKAKISATEIQLNAMRAFVTNTHPDFRRVQEELNSLRSALVGLEKGKTGERGASGKSTDKPAGLESIKLLRDVKYYQMLYELLAKQYEVARLEEAKDVAIIQVLDPAVEPERKHKPKRIIIVFLSAVLALFGSVFWVLLRETRRKQLMSPEGARQWAELKSHLRLRNTK